MQGRCSGGVELTALPINLGVRWGLVGSAMTEPLHPWEGVLPIVKKADQSPG